MISPNLKIAENKNMEKVQIGYRILIRCGAMSWKQGAICSGHTASKAHLVLMK